VRAYIVITAVPGKARYIAQQIAAFPEVKMADACWGSRDIFAVVEISRMEELNKLVIERIQRLEGVKETNTHIAVE
jgi:DNA-binding Lrp family transcriptional regulator